MYATANDNNYIVCTHTHACKHANIHVHTRTRQMHTSCAACNAHNLHPKQFAKSTQMITTIHAHIHIHTRAHAHATCPWRSSKASGAACRAHNLRQVQFAQSRAAAANGQSKSVRSVSVRLRLRRCGATFCALLQVYQRDLHKKFSK